MKHLLHIFWIVLILSMIISLSSYARAGGGDSGGSGGGSGGGGSSYSGGSDYSDYSGNDEYHEGSIIITIIIVGFFLIMVLFREKVKMLGAEFFVFTHYSKIKSELFSWEDSDIKWDWGHLKVYFSEAYFEIQECWRQRNPDLAKDYLSQKLLQSFSTKISWMEVRREQPIQENVQLLRALPFSIYSSKYHDVDTIWVFVKGRMVGYYINEDTHKIVKGQKRPETFIEYWKFIYEDGHWVLDEILQLNDRSISSL